MKSGYGLFSGLIVWLEAKKTPKKQNKKTTRQFHHFWLNALWIREDDSKVQHKISGRAMKLWDITAAPHQGAVMTHWALEALVSIFVVANTIIESDVSDFCRIKRVQMLI